MVPDDYRTFAVKVATEQGLDVDKFTGTLNCESQFNPEAVGDHGTSLGIAQIHLPAHPDVSRENAFDGIWSINWAAHHFSYEPNIWSCYNNLYSRDKVQ